MAPMKVFGQAMSTNVARVLVFLEEVGAEYEIVGVNFATGEHKGPEHLARNPFGQVPAFQDGDLKLFESRAISRYVLRKHKGSGEADLLREGSIEETALVDVWTEVEAHDYNPAISPIIYQQLVVPMRGGTPDQAVIDAAVAKLKKVLEVYEARLSEHRYLAGDFVSFADLSHFPYTYYLTATPYWLAVVEPFPRVKAWWEDLLSRPAVRRVVAKLPKSSDDL